MKPDVKKNRDVLKEKIKEKIRNFKTEGEVKRRNKAARKAAGHDASSRRRAASHGGDGAEDLWPFNKWDVSDDGTYRVRPAKGNSRKSRAGEQPSVYGSDVPGRLSTRAQRAAASTAIAARSSPGAGRDQYPGGTFTASGDMTKMHNRKWGDTSPNADPTNRQDLQHQGTYASGRAKESPVPADVRASASKTKGGKVVFGKYYDSSGQYLGRTQGGKWVPGASDPDAHLQVEFYNKLMEIESGNFTRGEKKLVKEMIREMAKACS
jgi:hypothetical protein